MICIYVLHFHLVFLFTPQGNIVFYSTTCIWLLLTVQVNILNRALDGALNYYKVHWLKHSAWASAASTGGTQDTIDLILCDDWTQFNIYFSNYFFRNCSAYDKLSLSPDFDGFMIAPPQSLVWNYNLHNYKYFTRFDHPPQFHSVPSGENNWVPLWIGVLGFSYG